MDYREYPPTPELTGLVKAIWKLDAAGEPGEWIEHEAVPDGCIELIRRTSGRSQWGQEQPEVFAAGIGSTASTFRISGDARFAAIRLWPWAWTALSAVPLAALSNTWIKVTDQALLDIAALLPDRDTAQAELVRKLPEAQRTKRIGEARSEEH